MIALTVVGLGLASYLTYVHYSGIRPACSLGGSCEKVQTSAYSHLAGVPVALMGLIGYVTIMILLLAPEQSLRRGRVAGRASLLTQAEQFEGRLAMTHRRIGAMFPSSTLSKPGL
jgi:uncharacterized membrane protein